MGPLKTLQQPFRGVDWTKFETTPCHDPLPNEGGIGESPNIAYRMTWALSATVNLTVEKKAKKMLPRIIRTPVLRLILGEKKCGLYAVKDGRLS